MIRPRWTVPVASSASALCALAVLTVGAAAATPTLVANPTKGPGGTTVALLGTGFSPSGGVVEIDFASTPVKRGIVVAGNGSFSTTFMVPGGAQAGTNAINAYQSGVLVTQTAFEVTPSTAAPTGNPPTRSSSPTPSPAQSPRGTPSATPTQSSSPASPNASESPSPVAAVGQDAFPSGLVITVGVLLAAVATAIVVLWWRRRVP
jgi:hypothetical protein